MRQGISRLARIAELYVPSGIHTKSIKKLLNMDEHGLLTVDLPIKADDFSHVSLPEGHGCLITGLLNSALSFLSSFIMADQWSSPPLQS